MCTMIIDQGDKCLQNDTSLEHKKHTLQLTTHKLIVTRTRLTSSTKLQ